MSKVVGNAPFCSYCGHKHGHEHTESCCRNVAVPKKDIYISDHVRRMMCDAFLAGAVSVFWGDSSIEIANTWIDNANVNGKFRDD